MAGQSTSRAEQNDNNEDDVEFTTTEELKNLRAYNRTVEVVGYVEDVQGPKTVGAKSLLVFQFILNNNDGAKIQVIAWNEEVERTENCIGVNKIVHLDGVLAQPPKNKQFNKGTVPMELIIKSNTKITVLAKRTIEHVLKTETVEKVTLKDVGNNSSCKEIEGFIKMNFNLLVKQNNKGPEIGVGSITDGEFKLEVRIANFDPDHEFLKGDHVRLRGYIAFSANPIFLSVKSFDDIHKIDETQMKFENLLRGVKRVETKRSK